MFAKKLKIYWKITRDHLEIIKPLQVAEFIIFQLKIDIFCGAVFTSHKSCIGSDLEVQLT